MKSNDLKDVQKTVLYERDPGWVVEYDPKWMIDHHPAWVYEHRPVLLIKYRRSRAQRPPLLFP